ncbi:MAG: cation:proton antiporter [Mycobacterium sp.]|nr:cation:proton antiporter [Mycobacterium sp.]
MSHFGFHTLALLAVVGMAGPLLAAVPRLGIPVVVGQLAAGILVGRTGFGIVDPGDPTFALLADIGFALVMFVVGTHVPVRASALRGALPRAFVRMVLVGAVAAVLGVALAQLFHTGHAALYAVLMASSSAALALPVIDSSELTGPPVLSVMAQIAIADTVSIVLLPLVIDPSRAPRAALGALAVAGLAAVLFVALRHFERSGTRRKLHKYSEKHALALELRISLIMLFGLAALAISTHVSVMLAGFALGLVIAAIGEPRRLARQLFGITEGFFAPLFFVWLGASLQVRELADNPMFIVLGVALGLGAVAAHLAGGLMTGQPAALSGLASAQLGVPVAAATLGTVQQLLAPGEPSALILGALITVVVTSLAGRAAAQRFRAAPGSSPDSSRTPA